ncbi:MAG TPA: nuclear transport factor 2 family protein [Aestuariivirgaceae bacterium]|nr:nuclear transport factor 2 family protein [Aestuariivirgaceae bacterium]
MPQLSELDKLVATENIKKLKARRDRSVDLKDWDMYRELHAPDHISTNDGYEERWTREDMMSHLMNDIGHVQIIHLSHTPDITIESADRASGIWYLEDQHFWMQDDEEHWLHGFGLYHEKYELRDGEWKFTFRRIQRIMITASRGAEHPAKTAAIKTGHFRETRA